MGVAGGIFNIIRRGQFNTAATANLHAQTSKSQPDRTPSDKSRIDKSLAKSGSDPSTWTVKRNESAIASFWRLAPEAAAKNAPTLDTVKRLEKMADSDNSDIAAEKMRQAKAKLDGLRRQLQMLAATGDVKQLRRIAAEAASLAREIGSAARSMAQGIAAGNVSGDTTTAQATASAANAAAQSADGGAPPAGGETGPDDSSATTEGAAGRTGLEQSYKALHELNSDARNAVVQAKGIIALAAQVARSRRRGDDSEDDRYFRRLQDEADGALAEIDAGQREALSELLMPEYGSASAGDVLTSTSLEITVETVVISQSQVEVYA
jgi:hypothetical protein